MNGARNTGKETTITNIFEREGALKKIIPEGRENF
jgi:hypothetical protein